MLVIQALDHSVSALTPLPVPFSGFIRSDFRSPSGLFFTLVSYPMRLAGLRHGRCQDMHWAQEEERNSFQVKPKPCAWPINHRALLWDLRRLVLGVSVSHCL